MAVKTLDMERFGPTRRGGPIFRWLGEPLAVDLANTVMVVREDEIIDLLAAPDDLRRWLRVERNRLGECDFAIAHLEEIHALRDAVRDLLGACASGTAASPELLERVNSASRRAPIAPTVEASDDSGDLTVVERAANDDPFAQLLGQLARSAIALVAGPEREELRVCRAPSCGMFFLGRRRWCCAACGNRARAARHYRRTRARARSTRQRI
jgi:predicted RNA-binding Zn ribbon-like protein